MKLSVSKTFISFTSHPAPSIYLAWACLHVLPLLLTKQVLPKTLLTIVDIITSLLSNLKLLSSLLSAISYVICATLLQPIHLCLSSTHQNQISLSSKLDSIRGRRLAQWVEQASHVQRLCPCCSSPGFESWPTHGNNSLKKLWVSPEAKQT